MNKKRVIFTNNKQSKRGIMSTVLCVLCTVSVIYSLVYSYKLGGNVPSTFGGALVVTLIMAFTGLGLGVSAYLDISKYRLLPMIGIIVNGLNVLILGVILWIGLN